MYTQPMIFPFDVHGRIYVLQDEKGNTIGTGTREVCRLLLYLVNEAAAPFKATGFENEVSLQQNVRAAITF